MKKLICTLLFCLAITSVLNAQNINNIADSILHGRRGLVHDTNIVGGVVGIYYKGETHYYTYGHTAKDKQKKVDNATLFEIGSNTKVFTALLLANEIEHGRANADNYIDKYIDVNKNISNKVRLVDLATHTSGLPTLHDSASMAEITQLDSTCPYCVVDNKYILSLAKKTDKLNDYGSFEYSNYGFALLGNILTAMNHSSYEKLIKKNVFQPLHMNNTSAGMDTNDTRMARGYEEGERVPYMMLTGLAPAGIIKSDVQDMLSFIKYEMGVDHSILDKAMKLSQQTWYSNPELAMGLGWFKAVEYGDTVYMMRGDTYGFSSLMAFDKQQQLGIVILLNCKSGAPQSIFSYVMKQTAGQAPKYASKFEKPTIKLDTTVLNQYVGDYKIMEGLSINVST
ncbi:MAG: beta-lactamase family protein, partial [Bacteroidetes bacterium]|nr:beta-lactamase family protein [Bacteroidota bacterium]